MLINQKLSLEVQREPFWSLSESAVLDLLSTDVQTGLSEPEAQARSRIFGVNIIEKTNSVSAFAIFLNQFRSPLIILLVAAGVITVAINHWSDALFIFAAVVVNSFLGFYQEYQAEQAIAELRTYLKQRSRVVREGREYEIDAIHLVPGDIVRLAQGDRVPADARLISVNDVQVDEAILTGEALPVSKSALAVAQESVLAEQRSMIFAGTLLTQGVVTAVVCRTDLATELGQIAALVARSGREETPLQGAIRRFSLRSGLYLGLLTLAIFAIGIWLGQSWTEMFLISVAVAVSAVPEGLPVAMTVILATGVQRMARRKGVVRRLVAAEALGSTSVILTDKTGTLTTAKMELSQILPTSEGSEQHLLELALLNTSVVVENEHESPAIWRMSGRVLETALVRSAALRGVLMPLIKSRYTILNTLPFNGANKFSISLVRDGEQHYLVFLGAPDILTAYSGMTPGMREESHRRIGQLAESGELVIGVATRALSNTADLDLGDPSLLSELNFEGLITLRDPVRPTVRKVIREVERSGIRVLVLTGDHRGTALAVAREVGLLVGETEVLDASELHQLSDDRLRERLPSLRVIARVSPVDKLRIVKTLQEMGEVVAMTGDGVNDAPSVKQADIGIAMGSGTAVTRDVADMVLLDDNFETIAAAVSEGRQIMSNIRKVLVYLLSSVSDALLLIGGSLVLGIPLPMNALQILWVNFFSDSFPAVAFAFERDGGALGRWHPSRDRGVKLFNPLMKFLVLFIGLATSALLLVLYWLLLRLGIDVALVRTFIFASFGTYSLFLAFSVRSLDKSILRYPILSNRFLLAGVLMGLAMMTAAVYIPFLQKLFGTVSLSLPWLLGVVGVGGLNIILIELGKDWFRRHKYN